MRSTTVRICTTEELSEKEKVQLYHDIRKYKEECNEEKSFDYTFIANSILLLISIISSIIIPNQTQSQYQFQLHWYLHFSCCLV